MEIQWRFGGGMVVTVCPMCVSTVCSSLTQRWLMYGVRENLSLKEARREGCGRAAGGMEMEGGGGGGRVMGAV